MDCKTNHSLSYSSDISFKAALQLSHSNDISHDVISFFIHLMNESIDIKEKSQQHDEFSKPMPWIGMYIVLASLLCILAMVADLFHGFRNRKLWFPCKYFNLDALSLTVIAVAMKLPVDLSNPMPGDLNQTAKIGSMAFMCTMMANLMPSIASMDKMELLTNIIAFGFLVITLIINVCIQIYTGVVVHDFYIKIFGHLFKAYRIVATIYVAMLIMLLIIHICSALTVQKSKQILESKYQIGHERDLQQLGRLTGKKLKEHVTNHSIMVETGSPQFIMACSATTSASGVICAFSTILLFVVIITNVRYGYFHLKGHESDYKWSTPVILITQSLGIVLGTIAPVCRCFAASSFKLSMKWIRNNIQVFKVESYWTQKLCDWKQSSIPFLVTNRKSKIVIHYIKIQILSFCIRFQMTVVVACKIIALIPMFLVICISFCIDRWERIKAKNGTTGEVSSENHEQQENNQDKREYVLQLEDDMEVADKTLYRITKYVNRLIQKAEKQQPNLLIMLLQKSKDFEGLRRYGSHLFHSSLVEEYHNSWSLTVVTLTTIAISLIKFEKNNVDMLMSGVSEGLEYVTLVEECLNATDEYAHSQKAARLLWREVDISHEWLGNKLEFDISQLNTTRQVLEWFRDTAKYIVTEVVGMDIEVSNENLVSRSICAYSMYCNTESLLHSYQDDINVIREQILFEELLLMIADILASCLTNIPQVIVMKCHTNVIEKREASVHEAAKLLGKTTKIINKVQDLEVPSLYQDELAFLDKWCAYFNQSIP